MYLGTCSSRYPSFASRTDVRCRYHRDMGLMFELCSAVGNVRYEKIRPASPFRSCMLKLSYIRKWRLPRAATSAIHPGPALIPMYAISDVIRPRIAITGIEAYLLRPIAAPLIPPAKDQRGFLLFRVAETAVCSPSSPCLATRGAPITVTVFSFADRRHAAKCTSD